MVTVHFGSYPLDMTGDDVISDKLPAGDPTLIFLSSWKIVGEYPDGSKGVLLGNFDFSSLAAFEASKITGLIWKEPDDDLIASITGVSISFSDFDSRGEIVLDEILHTRPLKIISGDFDDILLGTDSQNTFESGDGADTMIGFAGNDTYFVNEPGDLVVEGPGDGTDLVKTSISYTLTPHVENLKLLAGAGDIDATGNGLRNTLKGNEGANVLDGGLNRDTLKGKQGDDTYIVDDPKDVVFEGENQGTDTVRSSVSHTLAEHVEHLELSGAGDIDATGNALANVLTGNAGANLLNGRGGADAMAGGAGDDTYVVNHAGDSVTENPGEGVDTVSSNMMYTLGADVENLTLRGKLAIDGTGNALDNRLEGNSAKNLLTGGAGDDTYVIQNGSDQVVENPGEGVDTVESRFDYYALPDNVENLTLTGSEDSFGSGNALDNEIWGGEGSDLLLGKEGNDMLNGGPNYDGLIGGAGEDRFVFDSQLGDNNIGQIVDFETGMDSIELDKAIFASLSLGTLPSDQFVTAKGAEALDANDHILLDLDTGHVQYDADADGPGGAVQFANVGIGTLLGADDIFVFS